MVRHFNVELLKNGFHYAEVSVRKIFIFNDFDKNGPYIMYTDPFSELSSKKFYIKDGFSLGRFIYEH